MNSRHTFTTSLEWTGNRGSGTSHYRAYGRDHALSAPKKSAPIAGSSAKTFRGDEERYNPEELLISALSACHMLSFLHLCADAGISVLEYRDDASGTMRLNADNSGEFEEVVLHPAVRIEQSQRESELHGLHERAHALCFIARSVNFPVRCEPAS